MSVSNDSVVLLEYGPNHSGGRTFRYDGRRVEAHDTAASSPGCAFRGYLVPYWESLATRRTAVVFAREGRLYLDLSDGAVELLAVPAEIRNRLVGRTIAVHTSAGVKEIKVFTPAWRHLANDGMFPEDVEPIVHLMRKLTDSTTRARFIYRFENGEWPEA